MQKTILSTAEVARLFDVTETTVKRWADDGTLRCQKTPGGHRKFPMKYVVEFASTHNYEPIGALALTAGDSMAPKVESALLLRDFKVLQEAFVEKALSPDETDLFHYFSYLYQHHIQLWEIYDLILSPGMREIGERWLRNEIGIDHEHRASCEVMDALARLQTEVFVRGRSGNSVVCACIEDELHEIGLRAAAYLFESEGWKIHYLGARTPTDALVAAIREIHPAVVCLSVTASGANTALIPALRRLAAAAHERGTQLILGGNGVTKELIGSHVCDGIYRSAHELLTYMQEFSSPAQA